MTLDRSDPSNPDAVAYVSRQGRGNGVSAYVRQLDGLPPAEAGSLTMALGGTYAAATFVQPRPFYTAQNVRILTPKEEMTLQTKLWWALCVTHNRFRFGYGRHANRTFRKIELPIEVPDWVSKTKVPDFSALSGSASGLKTDLFDASTWQWFTLDSLFDIKRGRHVPSVQKPPGETPEVTSTGSRNGVSRYIALPPEHPANVISVARNGSVGHACVQPLPFFATDDVHVFYPKEPMSQMTMLFFCSLIRHERYRFSYGRKWSLARMKASEIRIPVDEVGEPDWGWIETFMNSLRFSGAVEKLS